MLNKPLSESQGATDHLLLMGCWYHYEFTTVPNMVTLGKMNKHGM